MSFSWLQLQGHASCFPLDKTSPLCLHACLHVEVVLLQLRADDLLVRLLLGLEHLLRVDLLLLEQHERRRRHAAVGLADELLRVVEALHQPVDLAAVLAEVLDEDLGDALRDPVELREA